MDCRKLEATLVEKFFGTLIKEKWYSVSELYKEYEAECKSKEYKAEYSQNKYGVAYCVRYRPIWFVEWILARWWWNDNGIWTEDWIFNDWIV